MKLKYYLRGLGIGIIVTTVILTISFAGRQKTLSDAEVIERAKELGMVMPESETENSEINAEELLKQTEAAAGSGEDAQTPVDEAEGAQMPEGEAGAGVQTAGADEAASDAQAGTADAVPEGNFLLTIKSGDVCRVVCENLAANGVISDAEALRKYLFETGYARNLSIGNYEIPYGATNEEIAQILKAGPIQE